MALLTLKLVVMANNQAVGDASVTVSQPLFHRYLSGVGRFVANLGTLIGGGANSRTRSASDSTFEGAQARASGLPPPGSRSSAGRPVGLPEAGGKPRFEEPAGGGTARPGGLGWGTGTSSGPEPSTRRVAPIGNRGVTGEAREVQQRSESHGGSLPITIWTFRIERFDESGNRMQPAPVEMRGISFEGSISDGDIVVVPGRWRPGKIMRPSRVTNVTTGSEVRAGTPLSIRIGNTVGCLIVLAIVTAIVTLIVAIAKGG